MRAFTFVDSRKIDRYEEFVLFKKLEDAEAMRESMGSDKEHYDIHEVEVIE